MNTKTVAIFAVVTAIGVSVAFFFRGGSTKPGPVTDSAKFIVGRNAIYVAEQFPSRTVLVAVVRLEKAGFVAIREDNAGKPGNILGASGVLLAGEIKNLAPIALSRTTADGETLYAMIHLDDGDGVFDPAKDKPALDSVGGEPVMMIFTASADASKPGAVNL